jgi:hypothetical protein
MAKYVGTGPHDVEYDKPSFSGGRVRNTMRPVSTVSAMVAVGAASDKHTIRYAFAKDADEAVAALKGGAGTLHASGTLTLPYDWECDDVPATGGFAYEHLVMDAAGKLTARVRLGWQIMTDPITGVRGASELQRSVGFEARVIRAYGSYSHFFVWKPDPLRGFLRAQIADYATFAKIWQPTTLIEDVQATLLDAMEADAGGAFDLGPASFLCLDGAGAAAKAYLIQVGAGGLAAAKRYAIADAAVFGYCGFDHKNLVSSSTLPVALATIPLGGAAIDYSDAKILAL